MANPTPEQQTIVDAFKSGKNLVIEAGAGTGKTTTLRMMAEAAPEKTGVYIAYNRAIADDAKASFPDSVQCATAHSFAFRAVGYQYKHRLNGPRVPAKQSIQILGITEQVQVADGVTFGPYQIVRMVNDTVSRFCYSADAEPSRKHIPFPPNTEAAQDELAGIVIRYARKAWEDIQRKDGKLRFQHDHYLKMWALSKPTLKCDYVLLDEAQDANPVIAQVVEAQDHAQKIMVGDRSQAIYGWRGAVDAMTRFDADQRLVLSQSFRFGPAVAIEANKWLDLLDAPLRLSGFDKIETTVEPLADPDAILCRTNAEALAQAIAFQADGKAVAIVGGTNDIKMFAEGAADLMAGKRPYHHDLIAFASWGEVQEYVNDESSGGTDLKVFVRLIDSYGVDAIIQVANATVSEAKADTIISTAHKAKGREWSSVKIASDFAPSEDSVGPSRPEAMLAYVAVTRAMHKLDNSGLAWVDGLGVAA